MQALVQVIASFQEMYPNVGFDLLYVPPDELRDKFNSEAYLGGGPSVLLAPAEWGPGFYDGGLVVDLTPFVNPDFLDTLNPAGLATGRYREALIGLPYALRGVLLYRNQTIVAQTPATLEELAHAKTPLGTVSVDLDRGIFFSAAHLDGLGGRLMDADGNPAFNDAIGLEWLNLLKSFDKVGITTFNSNRDQQLFTQGKVGVIVDGSWYLRSLAEAIGPENLAIDPWPVYGDSADGTRHLSGYVLADSVYLNANLAGNDQVAALQFIGFLLAPEVQRIMAEVGHIPSGKVVNVRDRLIQQAMTAFAGGTTFPIIPEAEAYWDVLELALLDVFERGLDPAVALQQAYDAVTVRLAEMRSK
jgi:arabinogalactan oligomer/maltooligosaccharide transport system substrate-binding protein